MTMILIEFISKIIKFIVYYVSRFVIRFIIVRDCDHCKHSDRFYCRPYYRCYLTWHPYVSKYMSSPYRKNFERRNEGVK